MMNLIVLVIQTVRFLAWVIFHRLPLRTWFLSLFWKVWPSKIIAAVGTMGNKQGLNGPGFVGLSNQGATCFLNTLLQTWYMTPEVHSIIVNFNEDTEFMFELKSLFEKLESRNQMPLRTNELTTSLKLNVFEQRDIEEYFRYLINKLADEVDRGHEILKLYQITIVQSLECSECTTLVENDCFFLDLPLSIHSADPSLKINCLELALQNFLKRITLKDDNASYCDKCDKKTETEIRYYFKRLPQILTIQLKRFEIVGRRWMHYRKIHESISIPLTLGFYKSQGNGNEWHFKPTKSKQRNPQENKKNNLEANVERESQNTEIEAENAGNTQQEKYELFAIWHHSGTYESGHYYAEIKSGDDWYNFNDSRVGKCGSFLDTVHKKQDPLSSKTAYLIMYRRKDSEAHRNDSQSHISILGADTTLKADGRSSYGRQKQNTTYTGTPV
ncbi:ubiquitin carboxyl-terminal hydrolase 47-like isoform X2 [Mustelus asterias]